MRATVTLKKPTEQPAVHSEDPAEYAIQPAQEAATATPASTPLPKAKVNPHAAQGAFLGAHLGKMVTAFTMNGIRLTGKLRAFDQFTLVIEARDGQQLLVFKHAVVSIAPGMARPKSNDRSYE